MALELKQGDGVEDVWRRKYTALQSRCMYYQKMNSMLFLRAKEIHKVIERAETETRFLVNKLEQYEEVDYPRCLPSVRAETNGLTILSPHPLHITPPHPLLMTAAAARIRAEVESALSHDHPSDQSNDINGTQLLYNESNSPKLTSTERSSSTVARSNPSVVTPQTTVIQGPPSLIPVPSPVIVPDRSRAGPPKTKRMKRAPKRAPDKPLKSGLKGAAAAKRRKGDIDPNAPKKPSNAFFWFCQANRAELQEQFKEGEVATGQHDLTKALARLWGETNTDDKKPFYEQYSLDKARYDEEMERYLKMKQAALPPPVVVVPQLANQIAKDSNSTYTVTIVNPEQ
ncbi:uncharacterized protein LOC135351112 [Halichondria panicea]|uniref:uncharacterized protein LOC135351112 n=1 Tax=Halichondria panicea TaxID=6063 RepID=UPI00312B8F6E